MLKKTLLSTLAVCCSWAFLYAQSTVNEQLSKADSLFSAGKYTESFDLFHHLMETEKLSSPAMLLKMAFIKEGLGDFSGALYYLNTYYLKTVDRRVMTKMEELAEKKELYGYEFQDADFVITHFYKYFNIITYSLLAIAVLLLALAYRQKVRLKQSPVLPAVFMVVVLAILFYTLNFGRDYDRAIIVDSNTYLMSGPSAGSEVIDVVGKGHRVSYLNEKDVWVKIDWQGKMAFIKKDKLRFISF
ncbi:SH3 domain-containing protein [Fulvivirga sp. M361]|uniref:SH3 domain-containing protein n=1 Tax=Fulvivirga sp. M361 TaxID=2594266 RepID=UPI00117AD015|nr:SH3 domain-containing protein [Fulvivirga sp. M361]TRX54310.1 SH3 domain-containing protein [Fulvivirga sp. M361]